MRNYYKITLGNNLIYFRKNKQVFCMSPIELDDKKALKSYFSLDEFEEGKKLKVFIKIS